MLPSDFPLLKFPSWMLDPSWKDRETVLKTARLSLMPFKNTGALSSKIPESIKQRTHPFWTWWRNSSPRDPPTCIPAERSRTSSPNMIFKSEPLHSSLKEPELTSNSWNLTLLRTRPTPQFLHHTMPNGDTSGTSADQSMQFKTKSPKISHNGNPQWTAGVIIWSMDATLLPKWQLWAWDLRRTFSQKWWSTPHTSWPQLAATWSSMTSALFLQVFTTISTSWQSMENQDTQDCSLGSEPDKDSQ